jgi:hypothetical protein
MREQRRVSPTSFMTICLSLDNLLFLMYGELREWESDSFSVEFFVYLLVHIEVD